MGGVHPWVLAGALALVSALAEARQHPPTYSAEEVKAAYLYNFAAFVDWPPHAAVSEGLVIGVLGAEDVERELRRLLATRPPQARPVLVRRLTDADDLGAVHVLYVGQREGARLARLMAGLKQRAVLTVTDAQDGLEHGAIVNFVVSDRVRFEISLPAAERAGLRLNARLLNVALRLRKGEAPWLPEYAWLPKEACRA